MFGIHHPTRSRGVALHYIYIRNVGVYIPPPLPQIYSWLGRSLVEMVNRVRPHCQLAELYTRNLGPVDVSQLLDSSCSTLVSTVALAIFLSSSLCYPDFAFLLL